MYIIHIKALERNTVIIYDHLGLSGLERAGNFILFFEFFFVLPNFIQYTYLTFTIRWICFFKAIYFLVSLLLFCFMGKLYINENLKSKHSILRIEGRLVCTTLTQKPPHKPGFTALISKRLKRCSELSPKSTGLHESAPVYKPVE